MAGVVVVVVAAGAAIVLVVAVLVAELDAGVLVVGAVVGAVPGRSAADPVADLVVGAAGRPAVGAPEGLPCVMPGTSPVGTFAVPQDLSH